MNIKQVSPQDYLSNTYNEPVFTQISSLDYVKKIDNSSFTKEEFYNKPKEFKSNFLPFQQKSDILINGMYWDNDAPALFTLEDLKEESFSIKVIADVTCDIAPVASVPTTIKASTISDPLFGYDKIKQEECSWKNDDAICMMTIDNLPNEMPRDASMSFGQQFVSFVLEELLDESSQLIERATITKSGNLGKHFDYLKD